MNPVHLDATDRAIVNALQGGFALSDEPFGEAAARLGIGEDTLRQRLGWLLEVGVLSRFGPMFNAEALGGAVTLAAMAVPDERFDEVAEIVNARREVAHNYARDHALNMWFVIATDQPRDIAAVIAGIAADTGLAVYDFPKQEEFFIGFKVEA
jgi:DNA-binding Lrp family transcriptional regulator